MQAFDLIAVKEDRNMDKASAARTSMMMPQTLRTAQQPAHLGLQKSSLGLASATDVESISERENKRVSDSED